MAAIITIVYNLDDECHWKANCKDECKMDTTKGCGHAFDPSVFPLDKWETVKYARNNIRKKTQNLR